MLELELVSQFSISVNKKTLHSVMYKLLFNFLRAYS